MTLFHGAGSDSEAPLLAAVAKAFCHAGYLALRADLPFRQERPHGPPRGNSQRDRDGIRLAGEALRQLAPGIPLCLAGHSYGGRQCTMLAAEDAAAGDGLMLLSYPLHPPGRPEQPRTRHFPALRAPALFVHGARDNFGSLADMESAVSLIPARTKLICIPGGGHALPLSVADSLPSWLQSVIFSSLTAQPEPRQ